MKQEERTRITYEKILAGAIKEFGTKSYENASLNTICNENHIAKGLLYHNFKNKDDLYLQCVKICFHELVEYLRSVPFSEENTIDSFKNLFQHRQKLQYNILFYFRKCSTDIFKKIYRHTTIFILSSKTMK